MAGRLSERVPSERLPFLVSTAPGPPLAATWRGGLPLRRLCGVAVVAAAAVALLSSPSRPKPWRSALGDDDLGLALLGRARGAGVATRLDAVMSGKPSAPMAAPACIGLEVCPPYPMPYPHGQWPESYDYEGESQSCVRGCVPLEDCRSHFGSSYRFPTPSPRERTGPKWCRGL